MAANPQFAVTPKLGVQTISTANTNRDGTGTISAAIVTGAANGTRVRRIEVQATGNTTAGMVRLYLHDGTTAHLFLEVSVSAITPSAILAAFNYALAEGMSAAEAVLPMILPNTWSIRASTHNAETFKVFVEGADL